MSAQRQAIIVGAGLTGCLLACYLSRRGYAVDVFERRSDPRVEGSERGRSINLALSERGLDALRRIGLVDVVMAPALPMRGRMMHDAEGGTAFQSYSSDGLRAINSISRSALNHTLLDAAEASEGVALHFDHRLVDLDAATGRARFETSSGEVVRSGLVVGADGWRSAVRESLERDGLVSVVTEPLGIGYKELTIPALDGEFALDPGALHIWPRGESMMIALPNPDRSFTCTLFWPHEGPDSLSTIATADDVREHFARVYPDAVPLMQTLVEDYLANPIGQLGTIHVTPWQVHGSVALLGDSAHAILPFFGQGANAGFEDVVEFDRCLTETGDDWARALPLYQQRRRDNAEAIALMARENFDEMSAKVGSRMFLAVKSMEHALHRAMPNLYVSRYEMVSFSTLPYADVIRRHRRQRTALALGTATICLGVLGGIVALVSAAT